MSTQKKITDLDLVDNFSDDLNLVVDDGIQTYRGTGAQMKTWVKSWIASFIFSTGDVKVTLKSSADDGWVMMDDGTIGDGSSGATTRANADTVDLFTLLWNNCANAQAAVSGGRGVSAAADYAAHKTIALPKALGRALASAGAGSGLTSRALGAILGEETHQLTSAEMPSHTHTQNSHTHVQRGHTGSGSAGSTILTTGTAAVPNLIPSQNDTAATATNQNTGGDGAHNNMQPTLFVNVMVKL